MNKVLFLAVVLAVAAITAYFGTVYPLYTILVLAGLAAIGFFIEAVVTKSSKRNH